MAVGGFNVFLMCLLLLYVHSQPVDLKKHSRLTFFELFDFRAVVALIIVTVVYIIPNFQDIVNTVVLFVNTGIGNIVSIGNSAVNAIVNSVDSGIFNISAK